MKKKTRKILNTILIEIALVLFAIFMFAPIFLAFTMSIQSPEFIFAYPPKVLPRGFHLQNYAQAFKIVPFLRMMWNSFVVAFFITLGKLITGILAGYAYANFKFKGSSLTFGIIFATLYMPAEILLIIPLFQIISKLGWVNTYQAMILPFIASATNVFLFQQHFKTIPRDFEDAAKIDGATPIQYLVKIVLPLSRPVIGGAAIINFTYAWNMYLWPMIVAMRDDMKTVQVAINMIMNAESSNNWGVIMAATMIALFPTLLLFFLLQDLFVKSLVGTGLKG
ncbi:carbohydrate ABC transporter membrane protein 2, CUT1 family [Fervidobacterium changbaicum]|uniref:Carbohydrate ABC transporter permease n=2 Tax=Fervidobacterium TaxID=2422 RepID=A0AAI8CKY4_FERIS|nr:MULTISPECIES: carbohydrate ABC transporter permease [Fervidobacterium]AMW32286.1 carbohydrate ABC transporter permease [Fervidobacterium islandicum]QAV32368.1 carbohydrate ABC transporter permease [Fervidobacterium changbaicum]SDH21095.1 carbohydrate ABC transporter membrane protein 2, CUT1 family [Fervidobacterium changbaicum]